MPFSTDRIIQTIVEGNYFTSELIFKHYPNAALVLADSCCQIYILSKKDMNLIGKKFPLFYKKVHFKIIDNCDLNLNNKKNQSLLTPNSNLNRSIKKSESFHINSKGFNIYFEFDWLFVIEEMNCGQEDEFVGGDEMDFELKRRKQSRRWKCKNNRERRYSRINHGDNFLMSKFSGLRLQWGLNNFEFP